MVTTRKPDQTSAQAATRTAPSAARSTAVSAIAALALGLATPATADSFSGAGYTAVHLLGPCQVADSDARELGTAAETECEQYLMGFVDALRQVGATGAEAGICPPEVNTADEIRWAFMRWVHGSYSERKGMPAADAVMATLRASFACN